MTDYISRADAIEAICNAQCELDVPHYPQCDQVKYCDEIKALLELPSAEAVPQSEQYKKGFEDAKRAYLVEYARESENMRKRNAELEVMLNAQKAISADAVQGEWIPCSERLPNTTEQVLISVCDDHGDKPYHYTCVGWKCEECWISDNDYVWGVVIAWQPLPKPYKGGDKE